MNDRILKQLLSIILIAGITLTATMAITAEPPSITTRSTGIASVKKSTKTKAVTDSAVAKATVAELVSKVSKTAAQPIVTRTTVEGNYAIATWLWGEAQGQAILAKKQKRWQVLSAGGGAINLTTLKEVGVPEKTARSLMQKETMAQKK